MSTIDELTNRVRELEAALAAKKHDDIAYSYAKDFFVIRSIRRPGDWWWGPGGQGRTDELLGAGVYTWLEIEALSLSYGEDGPLKLSDVLPSLKVRSGRTVLTHLSRKLEEVP